MEEVEVDKEFIVAVFWNNQQHKRSEEKLAYRHLSVHVKTVVIHACKNPWTVVKKLLLRLS